MADTDKNLYWHPAKVSREQRSALMGQQGCVLWFSGLSGAGKSTIARAAEQALVERGHAAYVLDGDNVRHGLNAGLGFSEEDREENLRRVAEVSGLFADCGIICLASFISPMKRNRDRARDIVGPEHFLEIYVATALETCEQRDTKGLYRKARAGKVADFTGISAPFEPPEEPELTIETDGVDVDTCVARLLAMLQERGILAS